MSKDIIIGKRGSGKTISCIRCAHREDAYMVVATKKRATEVFRFAREMGLDINFPITLRDLIGGSFNSNGCKAFVVDDTLDILRMLSRGVPIRAVSIDAEENEMTLLDKQ